MHSMDKKGLPIDRGWAWIIALGNFMYDLYVCMYVYVCMNACMHACMYVCMAGRMDVCVCMYV